MGWGHSSVRYDSAADYMGSVSRETFVENSSGMSNFLTQRAIECHEIAVSKGWYEDSNNPLFVPIKIALIADEAFEALRAARTRISPDAPWDNVCREVVDVMIRCLDLLAYLEADVDGLYEEIVEANRNRPHRHGGKAF